MHWRLLPGQEAALGRRIELFLHPHGYAGLQPIDTGMANLCFVMGLSAFQTVGASFAAALAHLRQLIPTLDERLRGAIPLWMSPASVAGLPYGYVCRATDCAEGLYRVGDQLAVIPSFTGEGIAIALRTARLAAEAIMAGVPSRDFVATARRQVRWPMRVAALLETMVRRQSSSDRPCLSLDARAFCRPSPERPGCGPGRAGVVRTLSDVGHAMGTHRQQIVRELACAPDGGLLSSPPDWRRLQPLRRRAGLPLAPLAGLPRRSECSMIRRCRRWLRSSRRTETAR